jgi:hypothetical protein
VLRVPTYPEDSYLAKVGRLAYAVSGLEWLVLGDLPGLQARLPSELTVTALAGQTTGAIARRIAEARPDVHDSELQRWLSVSARCLHLAAEIRSHVLHARPATIEGRQRLYRWRIGREVADTFAITDEWLDEQLFRLDSFSRELNAARVRAASSASDESP